MTRALITYLHFGTMRQFSPDVVLGELYYLPLFPGMLRFGVTGAIVTWLSISLGSVRLPLLLSMIMKNPLISILGFALRLRERKRDSSHIERALINLIEMLLMPHSPGSDNSDSGH